MIRTPAIAVLSIVILSRAALGQHQGTPEQQRRLPLWRGAFLSAESRRLCALRAVPFRPGVRHLAQPGMKLINQAGLSQPRLADNQHQLPVALPRPLPASHQHGDLLVASDKRRQIALSGAAPATACPHEPEQCDQLEHSFESMAATFFDDEEAGDLALHLRRHQNSTVWVALGNRSVIRSGKNCLISTRSTY